MNCIKVSSLPHQNQPFFHFHTFLGQQVCYTFDAGPNACIFAPGVVAEEVLALLLHAFPPTPPLNKEEYVKGISSQPACLSKVFERDCNRHNASCLKIVKLLNLSVFLGETILHSKLFHCLLSGTYMLS